MNKIIVTSCLLAVGLCFAQDPFSEDPSPEAASIPFFPTAEPPPPPPVSVPAPAVKAINAAPASKEGKTVFDALRGHAYNPYSTAGAATSVKDLVLIPSDIHGQKFLYISPIDNLGYAAFEMLGGSFMLGLDNSGNMGDLILGYATPAFGVSLNLSIGKHWRSVENNNMTTSARTTFAGDNIGLNFSLPLGGPTAYVNANWLTYKNSGYQEVKGSAVKANNGEIAWDYSDINATAGLLGSIGDLEFDAAIGVQRYGGSITSDLDAFKAGGDKAVSDDSYLGVGLDFNVGYVATQNEKGRVIVGANNTFAIFFLDEINLPNYQAGNQMALRVSPNILGEFAVSENLLIFTGAMHNLEAWLGGTDADARNKDVSDTRIAHFGTDAYAGTRYQKENWALEAQLSTNPFAAFAGNQILFNLGGFVYF